MQVPSHGRADAQASLGRDTFYEAVRPGARVSKNGPMLGHRKKQADGYEPYVWLNYNEVIERSVAVAHALRALEHSAGQETFIGFYAKDSPEWIIVEHATYTFNNVLVLVPLYETLGAQACAFIINQTQLEVIVCDTVEKANGLLKEKSTCPSLKHIIITLPDLPADLRERATQAGVTVYTFEEFEALGRSQTPTAHVPPKPEDLATTCYASGTTGTPKGVMLTHGNVIAEAPPSSLQERQPRPQCDGRSEQVGAEVGALRHGHGHQDPRDQQLRRPQQQLHGRPRLREDPRQHGRPREAHDHRLGAARRERPHLRPLRARMRGRRGLRPDRVRRLLHDTTEGDYIPGHVGVPSPCNAIKLVHVPELGYFARDNAGEVCIRGTNVFQGYYKNEEQTRETMDADGWLHTGDIGRWTERGTLKIVDRKKHIFNLAQGEYVAPQRIENICTRSKYVQQVFVHGESLKTCLIDIVVPDAELCREPAVKKLILDDTLAVGNKACLYSFEQVKDVHISSEVFSVENDLLTPTLKSKRPQRKKHFKAQIDDVYSRLDLALFACRPPSTTTQHRVLSSSPPSTSSSLPSSSSSNSPADRLPSP